MSVAAVVRELDGLLVKAVRVDELEAENRALRLQLEVARGERDESRAGSNRRGW